MAIQLAESEHHFIKQTLIKMLPNAKFYVFGSRAKGTARQYSDLDILVITEEAIPLSTLSALGEAFSESNLPFKVDIVDWHRITPEFRENINREQVEL
jgi:predicted nucleotidyltransferase